MNRTLHFALSCVVVVAAALVAACGGGGGEAVDTAPVAVSVEPQAVLMTAQGETRRLTATVLDATGRTLGAGVTWTSSDESIATVDANGTLQAAGPVGSAQVTAVSGSAPPVRVLVTVARPVAGARLIEDRQVVTGPHEVDATVQPPAYSVVLQDLPGLGAGDVVIAAEGAAIAGRVLTVEPLEGTQRRVRLARVPPSELFTDFTFRHRHSFAEAEWTIPPAIEAAYDVARDGNRLDFTPKAGAASARERAAAGAPVGTRALGPFSCEGEATADFPQLGLAASPLFSVTVAGDALVDADATGVSITVTGEPVFKVAAELEVKSAFEVKFECRVVLAHVRARVPGWAALFFGGEATFGVGLEAGGKMTLVSAKVGGSVEVKPKLQAELRCNALDCGLDGDVTLRGFDAKPTLQAPSLDQTQFEPGVTLFGFTDLSAGGPVGALQFEAVKSKAGVALSAALTLESLQIGNASADTGRSKYELKLAGEVGPGLKLGDFLTSLGMPSIVPVKLTFEETLGQSPTGSVTFDQGSYAAGASVKATVRLDPASTRFPEGTDLYNVERVLVLRRTGEATTETLAQHEATDGQTVFELTFTAGAPLKAKDLFAFVVTKALPLARPMLEVAAGRAPVSDRLVLIYAGVSVTRMDDTFSFIVQDQRSTNRVSDPPYLDSLSRSGAIPAGYDRAGSFTGFAASETDDIRVDPATGEVTGGFLGGRAECRSGTLEALGGEGLVATKDAQSHGHLIQTYGFTAGPHGATVTLTGQVSLNIAPGIGSDAGLSLFANGTWVGESVSSAGTTPSKAVDKTVTVPPGGAFSVHVVARCSTGALVPNVDAFSAVTASFVVTPLPPP